MIASEVVALSSLPFALPSKQDFLDNYLATFFRVCNFGNTSAMRVMFFSKSSKFNIDFKYAKKIQEKFFSFVR